MSLAGVSRRRAAFGSGPDHADSGGDPALWRCALAGNRTTTGGDISPRGDEIVIRTYDSAYLWRRAPARQLPRRWPDCPALAAVAGDPGRGLGFAADSSGYYTVSEGGMQPIHFYARR